MKTDPVAGEPGAAAPAASLHRYRALDSLRGICASMIVLLHLGTQGAIASSVFVRHGSLFVDFFFVLSGFVIAASYGDRLAAGFPIGRFMALRMGRIYPLHLAMLAVFLLFELVLAAGLLGRSDRAPFSGPFDLRWLVASIFLVQPFVGPDQTFWNGPSWSIAVEMWTYLIFAGLYRWLRPLLIPVSIVTAVVAGVYLLGLTDRYLSVNHDGALARCLFGFACGTIAYRIVARLPDRRRLRGGTATLIELAAVALTVTLVTLSGPTPLSLVMPAVFLLAVFIFAQEGGHVSRLLKTAPFLLLGTLSYSIYMVHGFVMYRLVNGLTLIDRLSHGRWGLVGRNADGGYHVGGSALFGDLMSMLLLGLVILTSYVTYRLIERPAQDWTRRRIMGPHPSRASRRAEAEAAQAGF